MTLKEIITHPATIIMGSILILIGVAAIGKKYWGWFPENNAREAASNCQCTKTRQCGRDQYCDGCNCVTESNVNRQGPDLMFNISPKAPIYTVHPGGINPDGGPRPIAGT